MRLCRDKLHDIGAVVTRIHSDPASSGTTTRSRPGLTRLLQDAKYGLVDLVCAEALDRISRDQEDIAGIYGNCPLYCPKMKPPCAELFSVNKGLRATVIRRT